MLQSISQRCTKTKREVIVQHIYMCVSKQLNEEVIRDTNVYLYMYVSIYVWSNYYHEFIH